MLNVKRLCVYFLLCCTRDWWFWLERERSNWLNVKDI